MKKYLLGILITFSIVFSVTAKENDSSIIYNFAFGIGTFSAGEYDSGSIFLNSSLSVEWIPNTKIGLSYGIESGINCGQTQEKNIILGIPIILRIGWYPSFIQVDNFDFFVNGKIGWAFGLWGSYLGTESTPSGIVAGLNFGGRYELTQKMGIYAEVGYNYYGLARNSNYPEYPLGYGSGKVYSSIGLSIKNN